VNGFVVKLVVENEMALMNDMNEGPNNKAEWLLWCCDLNMLDFKLSMKSC
jgi:hypothetical protein